MNKWIDKPQWVHEEKEGLVWRYDLIHIKNWRYPHRSILLLFQDENCRCCPDCHGKICNPNYIAAGNPCLGEPCAGSSANSFETYLESIQI